MQESLETHKAQHTPEAISRRLAQGAQHSYLRDLVFGAIDGTVTTFAVVSGVAGAGLSSGIVIVMGVANLVGDGFSMAIGAMQAGRSDQQVRQRARRVEESHIARYPAGEREEVRQILQHKGFEGQELERAVGVITSDVRQWVDMMLQEEHGLALEGPSPWRSAVATFIAFLIAGFCPLAAFVVQLAAPEMVTRPYELSVALTAACFFAIGAARARFVATKWYYSGLETLAAGSAAAGLAYLVGRLLKGLVDQA